MDPDLADSIYELDRCIECGCCVAACGTARMREDFVGAVGLNKIARFAWTRGTTVPTRISTNSWATTTACSAA